MSIFGFDYEIKQDALRDCEVQLICGFQEFLPRRFIKNIAAN
jgi:hypothetical protein